MEVIKNMKKIILVVIMMVLFCSCSKEPKIYDEIIDSGYGVGWGGNPDGLVCEEIKDAVYLTNYYFLTNEGKIYKFNETQLFSNNKNCIEYQYDGAKIKFAYNDSLYDENNKKTLVYDFSSSTFLNEEEYKNKNGYVWYDQLEVVNVDYDFISQNNCGSEILYIKDNNIYKYNYHTDNRTNEHIKDEPLFLGSIPKNEKILYMADAIIKTDKNYYELVRTNEEECNKYVDIKCEYGFKKSALSNIYDKLAFVSQERVVDSEYHMYGKGFCITIEN